ncbi:hypothetical protein QQS21_004930 [Conoideocrella luteorostrata]|uniref:P-loop containing nucleoside triphosphate hydrolase protein n=1 Tax=Conoideocrella luteorostrata TaxID=1105319 RepID=A0AAJ0FZI8_9HYPO|nr:hypothetical protein QQS21_004930 [Conoideocrella luteorostrata]
MATTDQSAAEKELARAVLDRQLHGTQEKGSTSRRSVFSYATASDKVILSISSVCAVFAGALNPLVPVSTHARRHVRCEFRSHHLTSLLQVIYGLLVAVFNGFEAGTISGEELRSKIATFSLYYVYLSIGLFVFTYVATVGYYYSGERIATALRTAYLSAILRQNMAFFDILGPGEVTNRIMSDMGKVQEAVTSKLSVLLSAVATFCAAFVVAFVMYWKTALIMSPFFVAMVASASVGGAYAVRYHKGAMDLHSQAANIAEEAIGAVRHVTAFGIQHVLSGRYTNLLKKAGKAEDKSENTVAIMIAWMNTMPCLLYALSFWAGSKYLVKGEISVEGVTATTLAVTIGSFAIIRIAPSIQSLTSGVAIADAVLKSIARRSPQDPLAEAGDKPSGVTGDIHFNNVSLVYPSRDDITVLNNLTFTCAAGMKTAIVGPSGGGKSSILGLIERFYEPTGGSVLLDGRDVQSFNLRWLRRQISLVDQNPVLFNATIIENIKYGCSEMLAELYEEEIRQRVVSAAKEAYAHDFITSLPDGYETQVGEKGLQLSGGQRQRIAIARALMKDPSILLLDEATSALDSKSEAAVQSVLDTASRHRTTIVVAHRLSTIRNADKIVVLAEGRVIEQGKHEELIARDGVYAALVEKQNVQDKTTTTAIDSDEISIEHKQLDDPLLLSSGHNVAAAYLDPMEDKSGSTTTHHARNAEGADSRLRPNAKQTLAFIARMSGSDWRLLLFGLVCAIMAGLGIPAQAVLFAKLLTAIGLSSSRFGELTDEVKLYSGLYVALGAVAFISWLGVGVALSKATQKLSRRVREICFDSIMAQEMAFFDEPGHTPGALASVLSKSTDDLSGMGGPVIGGLLTFVSTIIAGIVLSLAIGWKLALVCTATVPVVVACGWLRLMVLTAFDTEIRKSGTEAANFAGELVRSIRTVASLGLEEYALTRHHSYLVHHRSKAIRSILTASSLYAASQSIVYLCAALAFWYGGVLIADREYSTFQVYICFVSLISGAQIAGSIFTFAPDASKAMLASQELQHMIDLKPPAGKDPRPGPPPFNSKMDSEKEKQVDEREKACRIEFERVSFTYPSRRSRLALDEFSVTVQPGQTLAVVGQSGSGKTTCVSLLERFYEPDHGRILVDGQDIRSMDATAYREMTSFVSQETIIFTGTIRENVAIGSARDEVSDNDILEACKQANILQFVESLPDGLSTIVGTGGSMLSGGQKQRIAIARAFLRKPRILLLDEATSALDTESESVVQAAMDAIRKDRTTVMVAHRLSTIRNADIICVLAEGRLAEMGSHEQLMEKRGQYYSMVGMQNLD